MNPQFMIYLIIIIILITKCQIDRDWTDFFSSNTTTFIFVTMAVRNIYDYLFVDFITKNVNNMPL
jgi:hypothetical protein